MNNRGVSIVLWGSVTLGILLIVAIVVGIGRDVVLQEKYKEERTEAQRIERQIASKMGCNIYSTDFPGDAGTYFDCYEEGILYESGIRDDMKIDLYTDKRGWSGGVQYLEVFIKNQGRQVTIPVLEEREEKGVIVDVPDLGVTTAEFNAVHWEHLPGIFEY